MNIFDEVEKLGIEWDHHCSDLYIPVNDVTKELIKNYQYKGSVTTFFSNIDQTLWYDIPFAYYQDGDNKWKITKDENGEYIHF